MIDQERVRAKAPHWFERNRPPLKDGNGGGTSDGMGSAVDIIEKRVTRLEGAAVAAFIFLVVTFGGGYVLLSNQISASTERLADKIETVSKQVSDVDRSVARLEGASESKRP